jgi:Ni/Fe-hydrogenase subunit HybB-like protein
MDYTKEVPVIEGSPSAASLDESISKPLYTFPKRNWFIGLSISGSMLLFGVITVAWLLWKGVGIWGINQPVEWGFDVVNFVFWVGIGHAGTLISAILFLLRQRWRTGIARFAEAMTLFAVLCAVQFVLFHTGRPWLAVVYLFPYITQHGVWVNFISPLEWDVFAVNTYFTVSAVFWYVGLIPDLATLRDRATTKIKKNAYTILSLGWRFSNRHWQHYERAYLIMAGFATPLVLSVHTIVSFDFAVSVIPGWHSTIFPPYFVAGAIYSGFAMVQNVLIVTRKAFNFEYLITMDTIEKMNKIMLVTGSMVGFAYMTESFIAWYSGNPFEQFTFLNYALGPYGWSAYLLVFCNVVAPQFFWFKKIRTSLFISFIIAVIANVGMWFERFIIIVVSLHRDFLPSSWRMYFPTVWDFGMLIGSFGLFFTLVLLFVKFLPSISMSEIKSVIPGAQPSHHGNGAHHG